MVVGRSFFQKRDSLSLSDIDGKQTTELAEPTTSEKASTALEYIYCIVKPLLEIMVPPIIYP